MQIRIEVSEPVGVKASAMRDLIGKRKFDKIFEDMFSIALDELFEIVSEKKVGNRQIKEFA